jgi:hypothetical protein
MDNGDKVWVITTVIIVLLSPWAPYMLIVPLISGILRFGYIKPKKRRQMELLQQQHRPTFTYRKEGGPLN